MRRAEAAGVSLGRYVVEATLDQGQTPGERRVAFSELFRATRRIASMATSLNQLASVALASGQLLPDTDRALHAVVELGAAVTAITRVAGYDKDPER